MPLSPVALRSGGGGCHPPSAATLRDILAERPRLPGRHLSKAARCNSGVMQVKLSANYRVHVSRMMLTPLNASWVDSAGLLSTSVPERATHFAPSSCVTAGTAHHNAHFIFSGSDSSLLPPGHRCYALLSSALSRLVWESRGNSYQAREDGLS